MEEGHWQVAKGTNVVQDNQRLGPAAFAVADGKEDALADHGPQKLLNEESQEDTANGGEVEVVDQEERPQLEWLAVAHELATPENNGIVDDDENASLLDRRHRCTTCLEAKVLGGIANDGLESLAEDGP